MRQNRRVPIYRRSMGKFIIFVALVALAVQCAHAITEDLRTSVNSGLYLNTQTVTKGLLECQVETNDGTIYKFAPGEKIIPDATEMRIYSLDRSSCSIGIHPVQKSDAGVWKVTLNHAATEEYIFNVYLRRNAGIIPSDDVYVKEGASVHGILAAPESAFVNMKSCMITTPQKETFDVHTSPIAGVQSIGECGAQILGKPEFNGVWTFEMTTEDFLVYSATMRMQVKTASSQIVAPKVAPAGLNNVIELTLGSPGKIAVGPSSAKFCQLRNPDYEILPPINGPCNYQIPVVTSRHAGIWFMYYALPGNLETETDYFKVVTREEKSIVGNVTYLDHDEVKLFCSVHYLYPRTLSFCRFTRPDGKILNAAPGVFNEKYSALQRNDSLERDKDIYCGISIHGTEDVDYGAWQCEISTKTSSTEVVGTVVHVLRKSYRYPSYAPPVEIKAPAVAVKIGDSFLIKCLANQALDYCWFRSPNGTAFSVSSMKSQSLSLPPRTLTYKGAGLPMGECVVEIERAEFSDNGQWSCHLGAATSREESQTVMVTVAENYLIATGDKISPMNGISLFCRILPGEENRAINYCRWIRPDGYGIYNGTYPYITTSSKSGCKLVIEKFDAAVDAGEWTCVAGTMGAQFEELQTGIVLDYTEFSSRGGMSSLLFGFIIMACVIFAVSIVTTFTVKVYKCRQKQISEEPPVYKANSKSLPKYNGHGSASTGCR